MAEPCMAADDAMHPKTSVTDVLWEQILTVNDSFSSGALTRIYDKLKSAFSKIPTHRGAILQFWTPITIDGRRLLSTNGQPFGLKDEVGLHKYRLRCVEYLYNIDVNYKQLDINEEVNPMIINGSPAASAFLNHLPFVFDIDKGSPLSSYARDCGLKRSCMLPVSWPSQNGSCCIGVVECSVASPWLCVLVNKALQALQEVGLSIFQVQKRIPYQIIDGLEPMKDHIEEVLKIVCEANSIHIAQVWIPVQNDSYSKDKFTIKMTGYCVKEGYSGFHPLYKYYNDFCDMFPLEIGKDIVKKTITDYKPRLSKLCKDRLLAPLIWSTNSSRLVICLRSTNTGEFEYVFEFLWLHVDNYIIFLKALLLALKRYLPRFKVASGAELDAEFHLTDFENSTTSEIIFEEILPKNIQSPTSAYMKYPQQHLLKENPMVDNYVAPSETTPWHLLPREVTQQPFGNTAKEATENRNGADIVEELTMTDIVECSVKDVENSKTSEIEFVEIPSPISSYMIYLQQSLKDIQKVDKYVAPSEETCTTMLTLLPREQQFGNTIEEATQKRNEPGDGSEKVLQENKILPLPEALERGKKPMVDNSIAAPSAREYKTAPILLYQEAIEHQYGNTMKQAAKNLNVSISTLKRKCKVFGISEWKGPNPVHRKLNDSSNQSYKNEDYEGAVQDPSAINKNENTLTIKAEYAEDMIKFHLGISEATFITVEEEIGKKFKLSRGSYKLKYLDEDKDWILLASDQDMTDCMNSSRNLGRIVIRLCVLPSTQPISG